MPRRPLRLEAFTVLELLVVLVISALLFSMVYAALRAVKYQQHTIERKSAALSEISRWQAVLNADFDVGTVVELANNRLRCRRLGDEVSYIYSYADSVLVREQNGVGDTLGLPVRQCAFFWAGEPRAAGLIDEIALLGVTAQDTFYLQTRARYAAQQLLPALPVPAL